MLRREGTLVDGLISDCAQTRRLKEPPAWSTLVRKKDGFDVSTTKELKKSRRRHEDHGLRRGLKPLGWELPQGILYPLAAGSRLSACGKLCRAGATWDYGRSARIYASRAVVMGCAPC